MEEETIKSKIEDFVTHSTELGETAIKLTKINAIQKTANISANLIFTICCISLAIFSFLFLSIAASWWVGNLLHSRVIGFLIIGVFYLAIMILALLLKKKLILPFFRDKIVMKIYE